MIPLLAMVAQSDKPLLMIGEDDDETLVTLVGAATREGGLRDGVRSTSRIGTGSRGPAHRSPALIDAVKIVTRTLWIARR
jgi:hypothetical protein